MRKVAVTVGWYADSKGHNNTKVTSQVQTASFLKDTWMPHIRKQLAEHLGALVIYQSDCEITAWIPPENDVVVIRGQRSPTQHHHNDSGATQMTGAMYAYCNEMDFMFIEQDCFVVGLLGAYNWARQNNVNIAFSTTPHLQDLSRGEHCFTFVSYKYLPTYIDKLLATQWHSWDTGRGFPELKIEELFICDGKRWPFGYGRIRPINWNAPIFYFQQPTLEELQQVISHMDKHF